MTERQFHHGMASTLRLLGPPCVWALHFGSLYAAETVFCSWVGRPVHIGFVLAVTALAAAGLIALMSPVRENAAGDATGFVARAGLLLSILGLVAIMWAAIPALALPSCVAPV